MEKTKLMGIAFIVIGLIMILHHYISVRRIADIRDIANHEFFEAIFLTAGGTLLISACKGRRSESK
jgi:sulfur transfer protein SufE